MLTRSSRRPRPAAGIAGWLDAMLLAAALLAAAALLVAAPAHAQWGVQGVPVSAVVGGYEYTSRVVADGSGGVIVTWSDSRNGDQDIYAQRFNSSGVPQWTANGVLVCGAASNQTEPRICTDGAAGAIVVWSDLRSGSLDIYAQRVTAAGATSWTADGVVICDAIDHQRDPAIVEDSFGGAIFAWEDTRGTTYDIYVGRVNAAGVVVWTADGVALCTQAGDQTDATITTNGSSTATVAWRDRRSGTEYDVYVRRVNPAGVPQWAANGVAVCTETGDQDSPSILRDGGSGAIVVWRDSRNGVSNRDIYAQRLDSVGSPQWSANGVVVCGEATGTQEQPLAVGDGADGVIAGWSDYRSGVAKVYAQRLDGAGLPQWAANGVPLCAAAGQQLLAALRGDGAGGAHAAYGVESGAYDVYVQRVDTLGNVQWGANGAPLAVQAATQYPHALAPDGAGGVFCTWEDQGTPSRDIFVQRVLGNGNLADVNAVINVVSDVSNDQGGWVTIEVPRASADQGAGEITWYNVWRLVPAAASSMAAVRHHGAEFDGDQARLERARALLAASRGATVTLTPGLAAAANFPAGTWESVGYHAAIQTPLYHLLAPTRNDSPIPGVADETFLISAHTSFPSIYGVSAPAVGFSTDNLAPGPPQNLVGQVIAPSTVRLTWSPNTEKDLWHYRVYRGPDPGFVPGPGNRIGQPVPNSFDDPGFGPSYYKVSAVDRHGNESGFTLLDPGQVVDVSPGGEVAVDFLAPGAPNPFLDATVIRFGLARSGPVRLAVFDVSGRRVRALIEARMPPGSHAARWDGRDQQGQRLGAGVYLIRLVAPGFTSTQRLVMAR